MVFYTGHHFATGNRGESATPMTGTYPRIGKLLPIGIDKLTCIKT